MLLAVRPTSPDTPIEAVPLGWLGVRPVVLGVDMVPLLPVPMLPGIVWPVLPGPMPLGMVWPVLPMLPDDGMVECDGLLPVEPLLKPLD